MSDWGFDQNEAEQAANDLHSGGWLEEEGGYHFAIKGIDHEYVFPNNSPLDGFCAKLEVLAPSQFKGQAFELKISKPNFQMTDGLVKLLKKRVAAFFIATNIWLPGNPLPSKEAVSTTVARQLCMKLKNNDKGYLEPDYDRIYHVDDPKAASIPKDESALKLLPAELRGDPKTKNGNGNGGASNAGSSNGNAAATAATAGAGGSDDDMFDTL